MLRAPIISALLALTLAVTAYAADNSTPPASPTMFTDALVCGTNSASSGALACGTNSVSSGAVACDGGTNKVFSAALAMTGGTFRLL